MKIISTPSYSRRCRYATVALFSILAVTPIHSQQANFPAALLAEEKATILPEPIDVDARFPAQQSVPALSLLPMGTATNPAGHSITVNSRYLMQDGKPWLPVMGEFHFSRYPHQYWEEELLKMKAAGVQIVSSYIIWIHHEEVQGQFDWSGDRDLHEFVRLCGKHGLLVIVRIGPWAHAEVRNGGFPDWVQRMPHLRSNDPRYLAAVDIFYRQIAQQLKDQFWKDGGPVIGVQLENEYALQGPGQGAAHILKLKQLAVAAGFDVPLYTVTGWDGAVFPPREVLPVFGGYADWPWDDSIEKLPPNEVYAFRFESREGGDMGAPGGRAASHATQAELAPYPFLSAEFGSGIEDTYHRRPVIHSSDVAAMLPTQLGSGVNLLGYYMFQGGANPEGKLTTLQESQATGSPSDLPEISYDFQAPLGQYGEERESYRKTKLFHYFLNEFGDELAPMVVHAPKKIPASPSDFSVPRLAVRSLGDHAFLFMNNYVRGYQMPARTNFRVRVRLPEGDVMVPEQPITVPNGAYFIWPIGFTVQGVTMRYATAQLITTLAREHDNYVFFVAQDGIAPQFALSLQPGQSVEGQTSEGRPSQSRSAGGGVTIRPAPSTGIAFTVRSASDHPTHFVVLTQEQAERLTLLEIRGEKTLIYSGAYAFFDDETVHLRSAGRNDIFFGMLSAGDGAGLSVNGLKLQPPEGVFPVYEATVAPQTIAVQVTQTKSAGAAPRIDRANPAGWRKQPVAVAPTDATMQKFAAQWSIALPKDVLTGVEDVFLQIHYEGDVGRLYAGAAWAGGGLVDDNFYNGEPWVIGLKRFAGRLDAPLRLQVLPLRDDAPVYFDAGYKPQFSGKQVAAVASVNAVPEYEIVINP
ncbi:MAG: beta-galactosidase [Terriglobales bacterium]